MAADVHYIGVDSNFDLKEGYDRLLRLLQPHSKSEVQMIYKPAETVEFDHLSPYDMIFTSPPYEDLEAYPHAPQYVNFKNEFILPVLQRAFRSMAKNGWMCINVPTDMGAILIKVFGPPTETHHRALVGRWPGKTANKSEAIFCWQKRITKK